MTRPLWQERAKGGVVRLEQYLTEGTTVRGIAGELREDFRSFGHRSRAKQAGFSAEDIAGKPVIAILNTWSDANPCHAHFRLRAEDVKRGIWQAGGFPMESPLLTVGETLMKPSTVM